MQRLFKLTESPCYRGGWPWEAYRASGMWQRWEKEGAQRDPATVEKGETAGKKEWGVHTAPAMGEKREGARMEDSTMVLLQQCQAPFKVRWFASVKHLAGLRPKKPACTTCFFPESNILHATLSPEVVNHNHHTSYMRFCFKCATGTGLFLKTPYH